MLRLFYRFSSESSMLFLILNKFIENVLFFDKFLCFFSIFSSFTFLIDYRTKKAVSKSLSKLLFSNAAGRTRTGTVSRLILSQVRLPIPPQRHIMSYYLFALCLNILTQALQICKVFLIFRLFELI